MELDRIQTALNRENLDGWLFFDHHERDPLAYRILGFKPARHVTRRWYYFIPAKGTPIKLVHRIEADMLDPLIGERRFYSRWIEQHDQLKQILDGVTRVAMQYSPQCSVLHVANVDAGTVELVRQSGPTVVSSAELVQEFEACLQGDQFETHLQAGRRVDSIRGEAFQFIRGKIHSGVSELDVRDFVRQRFQTQGLTTDSGPIVAVNAHAGNPHYEPTPLSNSAIRAGDLVLLDMWAKLDQAGAVYYDVTWTAFAGAVPSRIQQVFEAVKAARDAGVSFVRQRIEAGVEVRGFEVDDSVRASLEGKGLAENFIHRTGHSISTEVHGAGANMDNFETHDDRRILPNSLFSVEPGAYFDDFGIRLELDVFVRSLESGHATASPTGQVQSEMVPLL